MLLLSDESCCMVSFLLRAASAHDMTRHQNNRTYFYQSASRRERNRSYTSIVARCSGFENLQHDLRIGWPINAKCARQVQNTRTESLDTHRKCQGQHIRVTLNHLPGFLPLDNQLPVKLQTDLRLFKRQFTYLLRSVLAVECIQHHQGVVWLVPHTW